MTSLQVKEKFISTIIESRDLFNHCLTPVGLHTDSGIEAAFLQLHKNWEVFLEETLICFLNGQVVLSGDTVIPKFIIADRGLIKEIVYQDKAYIEWTDEAQVRKRFERHLHTPNRVVTTLTTISGDLKDITKVRNFIAHNSGAARTQYINMVRARLGGNPDTRRASLFLKSTDVINSPQTFFDRYINLLEVAAEQIIG